MSLHVELDSIKNTPTDRKVAAIKLRRVASLIESTAEQPSPPISGYIREAAGVGVIGEWRIADA